LELLVIIAWLLLSLAVGLYAANQRGRSAGGFFVLAVLLSPVVALIWAAVASPVPENMNMKRCSQCAEWVKRDAVKCRFCGSAV
jgi:hypothetical protein